MITKKEYIMNNYKTEQDFINANWGIFTDGDETQVEEATGRPTIEILQEIKSLGTPATLEQKVVGLAKLVKMYAEINAENKAANPRATNEKIFLEAALERAQEIADRHFKYDYTVAAQVINSILGVKRGAPKKSAV
jgi:hypothetical protein